jgi:uncharacterized protein YecE (DUF72 family)
MQDDLFGNDALPVGGQAAGGAASTASSQAEPVRRTRSRNALQQAAVQAVPPQPAHLALAAQLPSRLWLGTSSWSYPGWHGLVWDKEVGETVLSRHGLPAYSEHPLLRTVSVDRSFYKALDNSQYAAYAAQVPDDFRFMIKAPASVCDATVRNDKGQGLRLNPVFLHPELAENEFVLPALQGLRHKIGALVFQISPLPDTWLRQRERLYTHLFDMLRAVSPLRPTAPDGVLAVEVRDAALLTPEFAAMLKEAGATYCLGLHAKMPPIEGQLPMLRALWPGPLVCRWNLHRRHGAYGYEDARAMYAPFSRIQDADEERGRPWPK